MIFLIFGEGVVCRDCQIVVDGERRPRNSKIARLDQGSVKGMQNSMAELAELSGTRSENFFGPVEGCQPEYVARKKLKRTASIGFQRSGRDPAFGITLP